jgi:hypothetical protein
MPWGSDHWLAPEHGTIAAIHESLEAAASLPSYVEFIEPLLRHLVAQKGEARARDVYEAVADALGLTEEQRAEVLPSGAQAVYQNRTGWANDRLKRAGFTTSLPGVNYISPSGEMIVARHTWAHAKIPQPRKILSDSSSCSESNQLNHSRDELWRSRASSRYAI